MTIINPHNIRQLYFTWSLVLLLSIGLAVSSYYLTLSVRIPIVTQPAPALIYTLVVLAGLLWLVGLLFKYSFRRWFIAWNMFVLIAVIALALTAVLDWNWFSVVLHLLASLTLLCLGPYLHFE